MVCQHLDVFGCGLLCALGLGSFAEGPGLSDIGRALGAPQFERRLCKMMDSLLYPPGLTGAAGAEGQMTKGPLKGLQGHVA